MGDLRCDVAIHASSRASSVFSPWCMCVCVYVYGSAQNKRCEHFGVTTKNTIRIEAVAVAPPAVILVVAVPVRNKGSFTLVSNCLLSAVRSRYHVESIV